MSPIQQAIEVLRIKGYSQSAIDELVANCKVDPKHLDRATEMARKLAPRKQRVDWAIVDDKQLIVRWK